jgi:hypothetical protein
MNTKVFFFSALVGNTINIGIASPAAFDQQINVLDKLALFEAAPLQKFCCFNWIVWQGHPPMTPSLPSEDSLNECHYYLSAQIPCTKQKISNHHTTI